MKHDGALLAARSGLVEDAGVEWVRFEAPAHELLLEEVVPAPRSLDSAVERAVVLGLDVRFIANPDTPFARTFSIRFTFFLFRTPPSLNTLTTTEPTLTPTADAADTLR